jgi:hypothetical protein
LTNLCAHLRLERVSSTTYRRKSVSATREIPMYGTSEKKSSPIEVHVAD